MGEIGRLAAMMQCCYDTGYLVTEWFPSLEVVTFVRGFIVIFFFKL